MTITFRTMPLAERYAHSLVMRTPIREVVGAPWDQPSIEYTIPVQAYRGPGLDLRVAFDPNTQTLYLDATHSEREIQEIVRENTRLHVEATSAQFAMARIASATKRLKSRKAGVRRRAKRAIAREVQSALPATR